MKVNARKAKKYGYNGLLSVITAHISEDILASEPLGRGVCLAFYDQSPGVLVYFYLTKKTNPWGVLGVEPCV